MNSTTCKICGKATAFIFTQTVLQKYPVKYYQCGNCDFIQTDDIHWLKEAYTSAITALDIGILNRNLRMIHRVPRIIDALFPGAVTMLDYAGGFGIFTRMMRDEGYDFYHTDPFCDNIFAKQFEKENAPRQKFDLVTAFEVFEHFADPLEEISRIVEYSRNLVFSTEMVPGDVNDIASWWYLSPETGQHIAFYSGRTLQYIAGKFGLNYYGSENIHIFTEETPDDDRLAYALRDKNYKKTLFGLRTVPLDFKITRQSLMQKDYEMLRKNLI